MADLEKQVRVQLDRVNKTLTITPESIQLGDGEWVRWTFEELQGNEFGFISFSDAEYPRLGPFYSMRIGNNGFLGKGNKGLVKSFAYTALILDVDKSDAVASGGGTIENTTARENTAPEIYVTYHGQENPPRLEVDPFQVGLNPGDTATWHFLGLPADVFACFQFADKKLGPFVTFNACKGEKENCAVEASGTGFALDIPHEAQYTYHIELRDWAGTRVASQDPLIDNLGPPPTNP